MNKIGYHYNQNIPRKKNVAWETFSGILLGTITGLGLNTAFNAIDRDLTNIFAKNPKSGVMHVKHQNADYVVRVYERKNKFWDKASVFLMGGITAFSFGMSRYNKAVAHNEQVDQVIAAQKHLKNPMANTWMEHVKKETPTQTNHPAANTWSARAEQDALTKQQPVEIVR